MKFAKKKKDFEDFVTAKYALREHFFWKKKSQFQNRKENSV